MRGVINVIIAVDFDGILCEDAFPEIGKPKYPVISAVRQLIDAGHEVILWTSRVDERLKDAVKWCSDYGLYFCAVNGNAPTNVLKYSTDPRKVYADVYIDDHSLLFMRDQRLYKKPITAIVNEINYVLKNETQEEN
jgi:hypothetical protein